MTCKLNQLYKYYILISLLALFVAQAKSQTVIYSQNFDGTHNWTTAGNFGINTQTITEHSGTRCLYTARNADYGNNLTEVSNYAQSPTIITTGYYATILEFWSFSDFESIYDFGYVYISNDNGSTWNKIETFNETESSWTLHSIDISAFADNKSQIQVKFTMSSDVSVQRTGWNVDDLQIKGTLIPAGLTVSNNNLAFGTVVNGTTSSNLSYNLIGTALSPSAGNISVTAPSNFEVSLSPTTGFAGSLTIPYTSSALTTTIYARFKPTISGSYSGNISNSGGGSTTKNVAVTGSGTAFTYCESYGTTQYRTGITLVNFNTINNATTKPFSGNAYTNYTAISNNLSIGSSYTLTTNVNTDGGYTIYAIAWIDWNNNGTFDAGEDYDLGSATNTSNGVTSISPAITVPTNASIGSVRMRVSAKYSSAPTACEINFDGEVEDYSINIVSGLKQFRSLTTGNWNATSTWEQSTNGGTIWTAATSTPTSSDAQVTIQAGHTVSLTANATVSNLTINGTLTENTYSLTGTGTLSLTSTGTLNIGGTNNFPTGFITNTLNSTSTVNYNASANQTIADLNYGNLTLSGSGTKTLTSATARTSNVLTVNSGVTFALSGSNSFTPTSAAVSGNVTVSNTVTLVKGSGTIAFNAGSTYTHNRNAGDLPIATWASTSTCLISGVTTTVPTVTSFAQTFGNVTWNATAQTADLSLSGQIASITGNFNMMSSGTGSLRLINVASNIVPITIGGNLTQSGGKLYGLGTFTSQTGGKLLLTINGNYSISGGTFIPNGNPLDDTSACTMNVQGNFNISAGTISEPSPGASNINFTGTNTQNYVKTGGVFSNTINFGINTGSTVDFGNYILNGSDGTFNLLTGGTIITANTAGLAASGATGTIQTTGIRNYNDTANYVYNGTATQITGTGLTGANNLTINNSAGVSLSAATTISNLITLTNGRLILGSYNLLLDTNAAAIAGSPFSNTKMIVASGSGQIQKKISTTPTTYEFPIGDFTSILANDADYSPITIAINSGTLTSNAYISLKVTDAKHPNDGSISNYITRYWTVSQSGISNFSASIDGTFAANDVVGDYNKIISSRYLSTIWTDHNPISSTKITANSLSSFGDLTGRNNESVINISPTALSNFTYIEGKGPSAEQSFVVSGSALSTNITVLPSSNYEISLGTGANFVPTALITTIVVNREVLPTTIYVRLKAGISAGTVPTNQIECYSAGATTKYLQCNGSVSNAPTIITSTPSLTEFSYMLGGGPSAYQTFNVSGAYLTSNIAISAPNNYEISLLSGSGYGASISLTQSGGSVASTPIYARLKSGLLTGNYSGNISLSSTNASTKTVNLSGAVNSAAVFVSKFNLAGFIYSGTGPSEIQSVLVNGTNLTTNITVTPPTNFEISLDSISGYSTTAINLAPTLGTVASTKIYVRMKQNLILGIYGPENIKVTATGAISQTVACSGKVTDGSTTISSKGTLNGFVYTHGNGPSIEQSFTVSAAALTANVTVTPPSNYFEISLTSGSGYVSSTTNPTTLTIPQINGKVNAVPIYVRLKAGIDIGTYSNNNIVLSSTNAANVNIVCNGFVIAQPAIIATPKTLNNVCSGTNITLNSAGTDIASQSWTGPNGFTSSVQNPSLGAVTPANNGTYKVTGIMNSNVNLLTNGDFELGNVGFGSSYIYQQTAPPEKGNYWISADPRDMYGSFINSADHTPGTGTQMMIVDGATTIGTVTWSQSIAVSPNTNYQFSYWLLNIFNNPNLAILQLYVNNQPIGNANTCPVYGSPWTQFKNTINSGDQNVLQLTLINKSLEPNGNDFALDDMVFEQAFQVTDSLNLTVYPNVTPSLQVTASKNPVTAGTIVTYNAIPNNGGTAPSYQWIVNGVNKGTNSATFNYTPNDGDIISCILTSNVVCATTPTATAQVTMQVTPQTNYWRGNISTDWGTPGNWTGGYIPLAGDNVEFATELNNNNISAERDLVLDQDRTIGFLINETNLSLIIPTSKLLIVNNSVQSGTNTDKIIIKADSTLPNGSLAFSNPNSLPVYATVEFYSKASWDLTRPVNQKYNWQYFGIPLKSMDALPSLTGAYVRKYLETGTTIQNHWQPITNETVLLPFIGYEICQQAPKKYTFKGQLTNDNFESGQLAKTQTGIYPGQHIFSNPYTAGMDIRQIVFGSDMDSTVYMYHTGTFSSWDDSFVGKTGVSPGQYIAVPQLNAGYSTVPRLVPSMSSMLVRIKPAVTYSTANSFINLNYNALVLKNTDLVRAPSFNKQDSDIVVSTRIEIKSKNSSDLMWIFSKNSCSKTFDNGEDGRKILGSALQPQIFATEPDGNYQIDAVKDMNNTSIAFQAGQDSIYEMIFNHENCETKYAKIYLIDYHTNVVVDVTENLSTYKFSAASTQSPVNRFKIVTKSSLDNPIKSNVNIFAADEKIFIQNFSEYNGNYYLYDLTGRILDRNTLDQNNITAIPAKPFYTYIVKVVVNGEVITEKVVIR